MSLKELIGKGIEQKGITFYHDLGYYFPLFSSLLKKEGSEKENEEAKIVINHAFLLDQPLSLLKWYDFNPDKNVLQKNIQIKKYRFIFSYK